jgi:hypothetical protein
MKTILIVLFASFAAQAMAQTYVSPYVRSDGTYVQGHVRSSPNGTTSDNYSTKGNTNPYTGQAGTLSPYYPYGPYGR